MNKKDLTKTVCQLVSEHLAVPLKTVKNNIELPFLEYEDEDGEPCCDSIDQLGLTIAFEEEFGVEISPEHAEQLTTIKAVVDYLAPRLDETGEYKEEEEDADEKAAELYQQASDRMYQLWVKTLGKEEADRMREDGLLDF